MKYTTVFLNTHYITADTPKNVRPGSCFPREDATERGAQTQTASEPLLQQHGRSEGNERKADVYLKCKNWPPQLVLPDNTSATYYAPEPLSALFGSLNEQEFSSKVWLLNPRLLDAVYLENGTNAIRHITRHYYEDESTVFYDSQKMSTGNLTTVPSSLQN